MADQRVVRAEASGPVIIQIEGFRPVASEVIFLDMGPENGRYEPLLGYVLLQQAGVAVDMVAHRLIAAGHIDLK